MAHGRPRDPRTEQRWRDYLQLWQRSGLSIAAFCQGHHLSPASFYAWRRRLQQRDATAFVPVQVIPEPPAPAQHGIELVLAAGRCLRVHPGFDPATLRQLLAVLDEEATPC
jgi:hypothetical protein